MKNKEEHSMEQYHYFEGKPICMLVSQHSVADKHLHKETEIVYLLKGSQDVRMENRLSTFRKVSCSPSAKTRSTSTAR